MNLWLDDIRKPPVGLVNGVEWTWAKSDAEARKYLGSGLVEFASLDHDLAEEHYATGIEGGWGGGSWYSRNGTGYDTICFIEENDLWPKNGVRCHSMNPVGKSNMLIPVRNYYGRDFQFLIEGTHSV